MKIINTIKLANGATKRIYAKDWLNNAADISCQDRYGKLVTGKSSLRDTRHSRRLVAGAYGKSGKASEAKQVK